MKIIDQNIKDDIFDLLNTAVNKLIAADSGNPDLFRQVGEEWGDVAHRVYLALDIPERSFERYHHPDTQRVLLDPCTVLNRKRSLLLEGKDVNIEHRLFWQNGDMIKTLCDYIVRFEVVGSVHDLVKVN